jgi:hypothetical protein
MISPTPSAVAVAFMVWGFAPLAAQEASRDVAFVEAATGRVVALASGAPALLGPLDIITDRTRVDLLAGSELRICHYLTARFLTVKGPARIMVSANGVSVLRAAWWPGVSRSSFVRLDTTKHFRRFV